VSWSGFSGYSGITNFYCNWDDVKTNLLGLDIGEFSTLQARVEQYHLPTIKTEIDTYCRQNFDLTSITEFLDGTGTEKIVLKRRPIKELTYCCLRVIPSISWYTFARWRHINVVDSEGHVVAVQGGPEPHTGEVPPYLPEFGVSGYSGGSGWDYDWETDITKADLFVDCANGILTIPPRILYLEMQAIPFWNYTFLKGNNNIEVRYTYGYSDGNFPFQLRRAAAQLVACQVLLLKGIGTSAGANSINMDGVSRNFAGVPYGALIEDMRKQAYQTLDKYRRIEIG